MKQIIIVAIASTVLLAGCQVGGVATRPAYHDTSPAADFLSVTGQTILYLVGSITYGIGMLFIEAIFGSDHHDDVCSTCGYDPCRCGHAQSHHHSDSKKEAKKEEKKKERKVAPLLKNKP